MVAGTGVVPFSRRLEELLQRHGSTQAWLADRAGVDRSLVSRLLSGAREPTLDALQCLAPALGIDVASLVAGTDAEDRLQEVANHVRKTDYEQAVATLITYESKNRDLEAQVGTLRAEREAELAARRRAEGAEAEATAQRAAAEEKRAELALLNEQQRAELARYRSALAKAVAEIGALRLQFREVEKELGESGKSAKLTSILAGVAAVTGVATIAHLLGEDRPTAKKSGPRASRPKGRTK